MVEFAEYFPEDLLQLVDGHLRNMFLVESVVREIKLFAKSISVERGFAVESEDVVGGLEDGGEVVDKGAGPVEDQVADHGYDCWAKKGGSEGLLRGGKGGMILDFKEV